MKLCFSTLACPKWTLEEVLDAAVAAGIEGVDFRGLGEEIDVTKLAAFTTDIESTRAALARRGLVVPCLNTSVTLLAPGPDRWQSMLEECARYATLAGQLSTRFIRVFGGAVPKELTRDEGRAVAQRRLRQLIKICSPQACLPLVETHDAWSGSEDVMELVHEVGPADAGVLWDIEHSCRRGETPAASVARLGKYLRHVHVKDMVEVEGKPKPRLLGEGVLPIGECVGALREAGYDGWLCLETEKRWHAEEAPEPEVSVPQFARYVRGLGA